MSVDVQTLTDPREFASHAEPVLAADPLRYSVIATALARGVRDGPRPRDRWWVARRDGAIAGLGMHTRLGRPYLVADTTDPEDGPSRVGAEIGAEIGAAGALGTEVGAAVAAQLAGDEVADAIVGVNGFVAPARGFADEWVRRRGGSVRGGRRDLLYELAGPVRAPAVVPGAARVVGAADRDWIEDWGRAFIAEIGDPPDPTVTMQRPIAEGRVLVWEVDPTDLREPSATTGPAVPVAMACCFAPQHGYSRVSWVWTRPAARRRGYGTAVTAAVSARAQADGGRCLLFADAADPVPNAIYRRLGYEVVDEACHLHLDR